MLLQLQNLHSAKWDRMWQRVISRQRNGGWWWLNYARVIKIVRGAFKHINILIMCMDFVQHLERDCTGSECERIYSNLQWYWWFWQVTALVSCRWSRGWFGCKRWRPHWYGRLLWDLTVTVVCLGHSGCLQAADITNLMVRCTTLQRLCVMCLFYLAANLKLPPFTNQALATESWQCNHYMTKM
jgi:hypothetical protein